MSAIDQAPHDGSAEVSGTGAADGGKWMAHGLIVLGEMATVSIIEYNGHDNNLLLEPRYLSNTKIPEVENC
jgi:hypothetical protein